MHSRPLALLFLCVLAFGVLGLNEHQAVGFSNEASDEYLDADSLRVLDTLAIVTTRSAIEDVWGLVDSTVVYDQSERCTNYFYSYCRESYEYAHWQETEVELCDERAIFKVLSFESNPDLFVTYPGGFQLSAKTTPADVDDFFPGTADRLREVGVHGRGSYDRITLAAEPPPAESAWMLFFEDGRLAFMHYWFPC